jgi:hypothetical protein
MISYDDGGEWRVVRGVIEQALIKKKKDIKKAARGHWSI